MNLIPYNLFLFLIAPLLLFSQNQEPSINSATFSIGQGFEDGINSLSTIPTLGLGYERQLNKHFSVYGRLLTYYRRTNKVPFFTPDRPSIGRIHPETNSPFINSEEITESQNQGLVDLKNIYSYKALSIPLSIGLKYTPIRYKNHSLNIYAGLMAMYESRNYFIEYISSVASITTIDNIVSNYPIVIVNETYFRNIIAAENIGLGYEYNKNSFGIELYFGENNYNGVANSSVVWDLSIRLKFKI